MCSELRGTAWNGEVWREKRCNVMVVTVEQYGTLIYIEGLIVFRGYRGKEGKIRGISMLLKESIGNGGFLPYQPFR